MADIAHALTAVETCESHVSTNDISIPAPTVHRLSFQEKIPFILEHCELAVRIKGERKGMLEMRRHLSSYVKGFDGASEMRQKLVRVETLSEAKALLGV